MARSPREITKNLNSLGRDNRKRNVYRNANHHKKLSTTTKKVETRKVKNLNGTQELPILTEKTPKKESTTSYENELYVLDVQKSKDIRASKEFSTKNYENTYNTSMRASKTFQSEKGTDKIESRGKKTSVYGTNTISNGRRTDKKGGRGPQAKSRGQEQRMQIKTRDQQVGSMKQGNVSIYKGLDLTKIKPGTSENQMTKSHLSKDKRQSKLRDVKKSMSRSKKMKSREVVLSKKNKQVTDSSRLSSNMRISDKSQKKKKSLLNDGSLMNSEKKKRKKGRRDKDLYQPESRSKPDNTVSSHSRKETLKDQSGDRKTKNKQKKSKSKSRGQSRSKGKSSSRRKKKVVTNNSRLTTHKAGNKKDSAGKKELSMEKNRSVTKKTTLKSTKLAKIERRMIRGNKPNLLIKRLNCKVSQTMGQGDRAKRMETTSTGGTLKQKAKTSRANDSKGTRFRDKSNGAKSIKNRLKGLGTSKKYDTSNAKLVRESESSELRVRKFGKDKKRNIISKKNMKAIYSKQEQDMKEDPKLYPDTDGYVFGEVLGNIKLTKENRSSTMDLLYQKGEAGEKSSVNTDSGALTAVQKGSCLDFYEQTPKGRNEGKESVTNIYSNNPKQPNTSSVLQGQKTQKEGVVLQTEQSMDRDQFIKLNEKKILVNQLKEGRSNKWGKTSSLGKSLIENSRRSQERKFKTGLVNNLSSKSQRPSGADFKRSSLQRRLKEQQREKERFNNPRNGSQDERTSLKSIRKGNLTKQSSERKFKSRKKETEEGGLKSSDLYTGRDSYKNNSSPYESKQKTNIYQRDGPKFDFTDTEIAFKGENMANSIYLKTEEGKANTEGKLDEGTTISENGEGSLTCAEKMGANRGTSKTWAGDAQSRERELVHLRNLNDSEQDFIEVDSGLVEYAKSEAMEVERPNVQFNEQHCSEQIEKRELESNEVYRQGSDLTGGSKRGEVGSKDNYGLRDAEGANMYCREEANDKKMKVSLSDAGNGVNNNFPGFTFFGARSGDLNSKWY